MVRGSLPHSGLSRACEFFLAHPVTRQVNFYRSYSRPALVLNRIGTSISDSTQAEFVRAGSNFHLRTASSAALSRMGKPEVSLISTRLTLPVAVTLTFSNTVPSSPRRLAING